MDAYRESWRRAEEYAERVLLFKNGRFLETVSPEELCMDSGAYVPGVTHWLRLHSLRKKGDAAQNERELRLAVGEWLRMTVGSGSSAAFALRRSEGVLSVLYGAGRRDHAGPFKAHIPECELQHTAWDETGYAYHGLITGTLRSRQLSDVFASSDTGNAYVSCIAVPVSSEELREKLEENRGLAAYFNTYKTFQRAYGNASRRIEEVPVPGVVQAIELLKEESDSIEQNMGGGFVRTAVRFGADREENCRDLAALILSCMDADRDTASAFEPPRAFMLRDTCRSWRECLAVPYVRIGNGRCSERVYALTMQDIRSAALFCLPPVRSYDGYYVKDYDIGEDGMDAFPVTDPIGAEGVELGTVYDSACKAVIPFSALHAHMFVAGATETGKTTTVKKILAGLHAAGIPFTVIEAAKKEYGALIGSVPGLRVYTPGNDGVMLRFNPLQPEDGVLIENHAAAVVRALTAATGGEHPIPEAFDGLLKQTYRKAGWEYGRMAYTDARRPFPTFKDVLENVDSYIAAHARYGPEVRQNLTAALTLRAENMHAGAMGDLFAMAAGLQARDLLAAPCVIELADFSPQSASFIMNILLFKFQSYLSRQPECGRLRRVIVVEEAHNIFKRTLAEETGQALNNEYFDKMLAEIRSSGTGLILSDQRPGVMSEAVMANTSIKIVHAITDGSDREAIGAPVGLSGFQLKKLGEFKPGECVVAVRGYHGIQHVRVKAAGESAAFHSACYVCTARSRCRRTAVRKMLESMDDARLAFHAAKIQAEPYNTPMLETFIDNMLKDLHVTASAQTKLCLLGEILDVYGTSSMQEKRIIVSSYSNCLKRGERR